MRRSTLALFVAIAGFSTEAADGAPTNPGARVSGFELGARLRAAPMAAGAQSSVAKFEAAGEAAAPGIRERKVRVVYPATPQSK